MNNRFQLIAAVMMFIAVTFGAMGAHWLKQILSEESLNSFETAVRYLMVHGLALLILPSLKSLSTKSCNPILTLMTFGTVFFSGSIFLLILIKYTHLPVSLAIIGPLTPVGGVLLIFSWLWLIYALWKNRKISDSQ